MPGKICISIGKSPLSEHTGTSRAMMFREIQPDGDPWIPKETYWESMGNDRRIKIYDDAGAVSPEVIPSPANERYAGILMFASPHSVGASTY